MSAIDLVTLVDTCGDNPMPFVAKELMNTNWSKVANDPYGWFWTWDDFFHLSYANEFYGRSNRMAAYVEKYGVCPTMKHAIDQTLNQTTGTYDISNYKAITWGFSNVEELLSIIAIPVTGYTAAATSNPDALLVSVNAFDNGADTRKDAKDKQLDGKKATINTDIIASNIAYANRILGGEKETVGAFTTDTAQTPFAMLAFASTLEGDTRLAAPRRDRTA